MMKVLLSFIGAFVWAGAALAQPVSTEVVPPNTMVGNWTGTKGPVSNNTLPSCADSAGSHINYVAGVGFVCGSTVAAPSASTLGGVESYTAPAHQWINGISTAGVVSSSQPAAADISGLAASATTDTTNASNIITGTLGAARLPAPTTSTLGGVKAIGSLAHNWISYIDTTGAPYQAQPTFADIGGSLGSGQMPTSGVSAGTYTNPTLTINTYGQVTSASNGSSSTGTVTSVSVTSANGFSGSVANATTTPAISIGTTVTGVLKGNGASVAAATSGTDYAPATSGTAILKGSGSGGFASAVAGTDYAAANASTTVNGQTCALGASCTVPSGSETLISTCTSTSTSTCTWTGLSGHSCYRLIVSYALPSASGSQLLLQVGEGGTPTWETSTYYNFQNVGTSSSISNSTGFVLDSSNISAYMPGWAGSVVVCNMNSTTAYTNAISQSIQMVGSASLNIGVTAGTYMNDLNVKTALQLSYTLSATMNVSASLYAISN